MQSDETAAPTEIPTESVKKAIAAERRMRRSAGINTAFRAIKAEHASNRSHMEVLADRMIEFASSTPFLVVHAIIFVAWILWNIRGMPVPQFDPYPYGMLTTIVSLEAIFLSIFVLMTQSRESRIGELREELTLQVNLRIEEEMTKTLHLVAGLYARLGLKMRRGSSPSSRRNCATTNATRRSCAAALRCSRPFAESLPACGKGQAWKRARHSCSWWSGRVRSWLWRKTRCWCSGLTTSQASRHQGAMAASTM